MSRTIAWFSCGAASAVATKLSKPDVIAYCETGSEDSDNYRFMRDCENWFEQEITVLKNPKFDSTWDVWQKRKYISGIAGAPCTRELKINPRLEFQQPDDIHIFGYTADYNDVKRSETLLKNWPDLKTRYPLIERGITKASCLSMITDSRIELPRVYKLGFPNANCIPCCKASSPAYWSLIRKEYPLHFKKMTVLSRQLGAKLAMIGTEHIYIDEIPENQPTTKPIAPECDMLCALAQQELN